MPFSAFQKNDNMTDVQDASMEPTYEHLYEKLQNAIPNFKARLGQEQMIASINDALTKEQILSIQAGTGVGKTFSYILGALPYAMTEGKRIIISTHTVALQTQLIEKDLPFIKAHVCGDFSFEIAKGSQHFYCPNRVHSLLNKTESDVDQIEIDTVEQNRSFKIDNTMLIKIKRLHQQFIDKKFDGDLSSYEEEGASTFIPLVNRDRNRCPNRKACQFSQSCPYYLQREKVMNANVVVANHALLSNVTQSGSNILGELNGELLVVDEAHHLPQVYRDERKTMFVVDELIKVTEKVSNLTTLLGKVYKSHPNLSLTISEQHSELVLRQYTDQSENTAQALSEFCQYLKHNFVVLRGQRQSKYDDMNQWQLDFSAYPQSFSDCLINAFNEICALFQCAKNINKISQRLISMLNEFNPQTKNHLQRFLTVENRLYQDIDVAANCMNRFYKFGMFNTHIERVDSGLVRWIERDPSKESFQLYSNDIDIKQSFGLRVLDCFQSTVFTSATLETLNQFSYFTGLLGLDERLNALTQKVASPFDYSSVKMSFPITVGDPNLPVFREKIIDQLKLAVNRHKSILVLFSSYRELNDVYDMCPSALKHRISRQTDWSKARLIERHQQRIDSGETSILFGVDGLSEGLDLKEEYLTCVIITKLPFPNVSDPMLKHENNVIKENGGIPFMQLSLPICSRKLIQSVGRLIRTENDYGEIMLLDPRVKTKRYGAQLLNALPMNQGTYLNNNNRSNYGSWY